MQEVYLGNKGMGTTVSEARYFWQLFRPKQEKTRCYQRLHAAHYYRRT